MFFGPQAHRCAEENGKGQQDQEVEPAVGGQAAQLDQANG